MSAMSTSPSAPGADATRLAPSLGRAWCYLVALSFRRQARARQMVWIALGLLGFIAAMTAVATAADQWRRPRYRQIVAERQAMIDAVRPGDPAQAIAEVASGVATAAVLPMPSDGEPASAAWWLGLMTGKEPRVHVVGMLPFWSSRPEDAPRVEAVVVAAIPPDPSGADRSLLGLAIAPDLGRARLAAALASAGLSAGRIILAQEPGEACAHALIDVEDYITDADPRLGAIRPVQRVPLVLGAYAVPVGGEPA